jgi:hypothetical protein
MSLISINDVLKITTKVEKIHPYKVVGDRDSYSSYNKGWNDCVSLIESYLEKMSFAEQWIPVTEALPEEGESVIVCSRYGAICIVSLVKGISEETRKKMKNGEIDDPCEQLWCLSEGYTMSKRSDLYKEGDEFGNNQKDYAWKNGPYHYSGQDFIAWMPLPEPYQGE